MRFYTQTHRYYCGIDLHARWMYLCILDPQGEVLLHRNLRACPETFLKAVDPYRQDLVVAVECIFSWYWLADLCAQHGIEFVLGHALYMKAIHGGKAKNDRIDSQKIAVLLRGGMIPVAYVYPPQMRSTRDLLRRRTYLCANGPSCWFTFKTPTANTTCPRSERRSPTEPTVPVWLNASPILLSRPVSLQTCL